MSARREDAALSAIRRDALVGAAAAGFVGLFVSALHFAGPMFMIQVYDRVITGRSVETLAALAALVIALLIFQATLDVLRRRIFVALGERFALRIGQPVLTAAVEASFAGRPDATGAMRDVADLRAFLVSGAVALPFDALAAPLFLAGLFLLHVDYGLIGVFGALTLTATAIVNEAAARRPVKQAAEAANLSNLETQTAIRRAEVVVALGMMRPLLARWRRAHFATVAAQSHAQGAAAGLAVTARFIRQGLQIGIIALGAMLVIEREVSPGTLIAASVILGRLLAPFEELIGGWRQWCEARVRYDRISQLLEDAPQRAASPPILIREPRLKVERVAYARKSGPSILRNVSFELSSGELLGVVGASGAGKSTLARLVVGLARPISGSVRLDGMEAALHERESFAAAVGYLPQEPMLLEGSVRENIARMSEGAVEEAVAAARLAGVHDVIGQLPEGYETRVSAAGAPLSGGQRQRVALARALFRDPKLLVLDEPNSSLDADGEAALIAAIDATRARGAAVLVVAQRMAILNRADRLLVLKDGVVAHYGARAEVMRELGPRGARRVGSGAAIGADREVAS